MTQSSQGEHGGVTDEALMDRLRREGDTEALSMLMDRYNPRLYAVSRRYLSDDSEIEDLAQETWLSIYQGRGRFRPGARFSSWLYTVHLNKCRDRLRGAGREKRRARIADWAEAESAPDPSATTPEDAAVRAQRRLMVLSALERLPARQREVLVLSLTEGLSFEEIARRLDCPAGTARSNMHYAVRRLRDLVGGREME